MSNKKFEWNRVTWFSKTVALILFVALPFVGFWYGIRYGETLQFVHDLGVILGEGIGRSQSATPTPGASYYNNVSTWQTDSRSDAGFSIAYPIDFQENDNNSLSPSTDWFLNASEPGVLAFTLMIPSAFDPQTNFADAKLTVGYSANATAISQCLEAPPSGLPPTASSTTNVNGVTFIVFNSSDAGAGNFYQTTSYRTVHAGACWVVEYTIHSSQIANYPASYELQPYDTVSVTGVLDRIAHTFRFL